MASNSPVISIDGPAGSGKSTASRRLAERLGFRYFDTGSIYRSLAWCAQEQRLGWDCSEEELVGLCHNLVLEFEQGSEEEDWRTLVNGKDLTLKLQGEEIARGASLVSAFPKVRESLLRLQRREAKPPGLVMEGRDVGTVVFPGALVKFFLTADVKVRAQRRWLEMERFGGKENLALVEREIRARDERDRTRQVAPLKPAKDAVFIETNQMKVDEVVEIMVDMTLQSLSARLNDES